MYKKERVKVNSQQIKEIQKKHRQLILNKNKVSERPKEFKSNDYQT